MAHRPDCPCPACRYRRGEGRGQAPQLSVRVAPEVRDYLLSHPDGARAVIERLVAQEVDQPSPSREELVAELEATRELAAKAQSYRTSNKLIKEDNEELRRTVRQLAFELQNAQAALKQARYGLLQFAERSPGDIFEEQPTAIAVVARSALKSMDACLAANPLPRARRRSS